VFSMLARSLDHPNLREIIGVHVRQGVSARAPRVVSSGSTSLDDLLPDGGFTPGLVELAAPHSLGGGTSLALAFMREIQSSSNGERSPDPRAHELRTHQREGWCAWIEARDSPLGHLFAPAVVQAGVDLERLLVVRVEEGRQKRRANPSLDKSLARAALKVSASGGFACVAVCGGRFDEASARKFALSSEEHGHTVFLLTDTLAPHPPWPVSLRLELLRTAEGISVRVAKDKRGRSGASGTLALSTSAVAA